MTTTSESSESSLKDMLVGWKELNIMRGTECSVTIRVGSGAEIQLQPLANMFGRKAAAELRKHVSKRRQQNYPTESTHETKSRRVVNGADCGEVPIPTHVTAIEAGLSQLRNSTHALAAGKMLGRKAGADIRKYVAKRKQQNYSTESSRGTKARRVVNGEDHGEVAVPINAPDIDAGISQMRNAIGDIDFGSSEARIQPTTGQLAAIPRQHRGERLDWATMVEVEPQPEVDYDEATHRTIPQNDYQDSKEYQGRLLSAMFSAEVPPTDAQCCQSVEHAGPLYICVDCDVC
ncbi:hypothetical protein M422DRAFT_49536 [Sphaerobolus stellatus SS14]|uniref:Unplaced genomic scaffold SPHSTscaffold_75, whole genome shotgun sequence n=1 Tax=Sphaerobolus stellatus (strain SS14) TaxID=990650 RepID=A0A0C9VPB3_SPHS4|nr:hypothetical protein M422DRAFT_49536 [Sphaerobolus stellatus SS14]